MAGPIILTEPSVEQVAPQRPPQVTPVQAPPVRNGPPPNLQPNPVPQPGYQHPNPSMRPPQNHARPINQPPTNHRPGPGPANLNPGTNTYTGPGPQIPRNPAMAIAGGSTPHPSIGNNAIPPNPPATFYSAKAVTISNDAPVVQAQNAKFNPNAVSPSIRRTGLVDNNVSGPVPKHHLNQGVNPVPANPSPTTRQIGVPYSANPNMNRNSYKPPGPGVGVPKTPLKENGNALNPTDQAMDSSKRLKAS
jgi:hypothetical protein